MPLEASSRNIVPIQNTPSVEAVSILGLVAATADPLHSFGAYRHVRIQSVLHVVTAIHSSDLGNASG